MIDSHCHLNFESLSKDISNIIQRCYENGVTHLLSINTRPKDFENHLDLIKNYNNIYISYGIHPEEIDNESKFSLIELEKVIESQFITRSLSNRADELTVQAKELSAQNVIASKLSNLSLQLYGLFLKTGYVKNDEEYKKVTNYFNKRMPAFKIEKLGFREKLWLYKSYLWYSFLTQDFKSCYKYSRKWVDLFHDNKKMIR